MSLNNFHLNERPFSAIPIAEHCCLFPSFHENLTAVETALGQELGPALILGSAGTGKTMLLRALAQRHQQKAAGVCLTLDADFNNREALFQTLLFELGLESNGTSPNDLRLVLTAAIRTRPEFAEGVWLLIDEAHSLPPQVFEQLRLLLNMVRDGRSVFQIAIAGSPNLEEQLLTPALDSLQQRIACRVYLTGMSLEELRGYIEFHWRRVGGQQSPFTYEAVQAVHTATMGIPRLVNQLCDQAISYAAAQRMMAIDQNAIQVAWAMWQRLPIPPQTVRTNSATTTNTAATGHVVEFGSLDEEPVASGSETWGSEKMGAEKMGSETASVLQGPPAAKNADPGMSLVSTTSVSQLEPVVIAPSVIAPSGMVTSGPAAARTAASGLAASAPETRIRFAFETDIQKPVVKTSAENGTFERGDSAGPSTVTRAALSEMEAKIDTIQQALHSLQEPWDPIEEMLIEADLQAIVSPIEIFDQPAHVTQEMLSNEPSIVFQDHLYLESLWMEDTVWTQYIRTPETNDENFPVSLTLPIADSQQAVPPAVEPGSAAAAGEIRIDEVPHRKVNPPQSLSRWESVPAIDSPRVDWCANEPALGQEVRAAEETFQDDARIIHRQPVVTANGAGRDVHPPQTVPPPVLARRKDLRALLHALRGY